MLRRGDPLAVGAARAGPIPLGRPVDSGEPKRRDSRSGTCGRSIPPILKGVHMPGNLIYYALVLIVIALVAALLGFGGVASTAMGGAHLLIWVAVIVLIIGVVFALIRRT